VIRPWGRPSPSCRTGSQTSYARNRDSCEIEDVMVNYNHEK